MRITCRQDHLVCPRPTISSGSVGAKRLPTTLCFTRRRKYLPIKLWRRPTEIVASVSGNQIRPGPKQANYAVLSGGYAMPRILTMKLLLAGAFCVGIFGLQACSTTELSAPTSSAGMANLAPGAGDETLRVVAELPAPLAIMDGVAQPVAVSDMLEVTVFQVPDLSRTVQVDDAGNISLPLIGAVKAAGKSVQALQRDIEAAYGRNYLQSPSVSVLGEESPARRAGVAGQPRLPGLFRVATA